MQSRLTAAFGTFFLSFNISANDIETITVSATPIRVDDAGSSITVITREEMQRRNSTIQSLLRSVPGFSVNQQGSIGAVTQVRVRGAEANQVLVMINGIEANDLSQGSEFDFSQISVSDIERIEIVRGPQSALWGSDAMAGVIHIITQPEDGETGFTASAETGSFATNRATFGGRYSGSKNRLKFSADYLDTDGTNISRHGNEEDGLENLTLSLSGTYAASKDLTIKYTARHTDKTTDFDGVDFFTDGLPVDADNDTNSRYLYSGVTVSHLINESLDQSLGFSRTDTDNKTKPGDSVTRGIRDALRYQFNYIGQSHRISLRAEYENEEYEQRGAASFFGDPNQDQDTRTHSIATEYRFDHDWINLSLSFRHDDNSDFEDANSWRMTANTKRGDTIFHASVGESVKNPTFTERFGYFTNFVGNPNLEPEESLHWEVGARRPLLDGKLNLAVVWFNANLDNEINGFVFDAGSGGFTSANIDGKSNREGAELEISYAPSDRFNLQATYTYLDATQEDFTGSDITEVRRPKHSGSVSMNYAWEKVGLNLAVSHTGAQDDDYFPPFPPFQERVELDAFTLVELSGFYQVSPRVTLTARLENILDEDYEQVFGFESPGFGAHVGVRVSW